MPSLKNSIILLSRSSAGTPSHVVLDHFSVEPIYPIDLDISINTKITYYIIIFIWYKLQNLMLKPYTLNILYYNITYLAATLILQPLQTLN
jgi:hypothetical protein